LLVFVCGNCFGRCAAGRESAGRFGGFAGNCADPGTKDGGNHHNALKWRKLQQAAD
jgi:hypothetical protein